MTVSDVKAETWLPVPGAGYYEVSNEAHDIYGVRSVKRTIGRVGYDGQPIKAKKTGTSRYWQVKIRDDDGREWTTTVHSLVLLAHVGPCPPGMEACHADDDPGNNRLANLRWDWPSANMDDRRRNSPAAPKPVKQCILCGAEIATGRRCEDCRARIGRDAAELLWDGVSLAKACELLDYASTNGLHEMARKYGGYGQRPMRVIEDEVNAAQRQIRHAPSPWRRLRSVLIGRGPSRQNSDAQ